MQYFLHVISMLISFNQLEPLLELLMPFQYLNFHTVPWNLFLFSLQLGLHLSLYYHWFSESVLYICILRYIMQNLQEMKHEDCKFTGNLEVRVLKYIA